MTTHTLKIEVLGSFSVTGAIFVEKNGPGYVGGISSDDTVKVYPEKSHPAMDYRKIKEDLHSAIELFDLDYIEVIDSTGNIICNAGK